MTKWTKAAIMKVAAFFIEQDRMGEKNNIPLGMGLLASGSFMILMMNALAKLMNESGLTTVETIALRNIGCFLIVSAIIIALKKPQLFKTGRLKSHIFRAVIGNANALIVFWAYTLLPLATVTAILLLAPVLATALSAIFLKEKVNAVRWASVFLGLIGALIITQPGGQSFSFGHIVALTGALASAIVYICLRDLGRSENALTTTFYFFGFGTLAVLPLLPFGYSASAGDAYLGILLAGLLLSGLLNQILKTLAFTFAQASVLSPVKYLDIVWSTLLGLLIWHEIPGAHVYIGCAVIILSNLLITYREHRLNVQRNTP